MKITCKIIKFPFFIYLQGDSSPVMPWLSKSSMRMRVSSWRWCASTKGAARRTPSRMLPADTDPGRQSLTLRLLRGGELIELRFGMANLPTTGSKLSETPSLVINTMSPVCTSVIEQVRLLSSGFSPSTGPSAPSASRMSRIEFMS